jgi:hypothetical protein
LESAAVVAPAEELLDDPGAAVGSGLDHEAGMARGASRAEMQQVQRRLDVRVGRDADQRAGVGEGLGEQGEAVVGVLARHAQPPASAGSRSSALPRSSTVTPAGRPRSERAGE